LPFELERSPSMASRMPALCSSSLYLPILAISSGLGRMPASDSLLAFTITITRIAISFLCGSERALRLLWPALSLSRTRSGEIDSFLLTNSRLAASRSPHESPRGKKEVPQSRRPAGFPPCPNDPPGSARRCRWPHRGPWLPPGRIHRAVRVSPRRDRPSPCVSLREHARWLPLRLRAAARQLDTARWRSAPAHTAWTPGNTAPSPPRSARSHPGRSASRISSLCLHFGFL